MSGAKTYKIRFFRTWPAACILLAISGGGWATYLAGTLLFKNPQPLLIFGWFLVVLALMCFLVVVILTGLMTVTTTDDGLTIARLDTKVHVGWNDIKRIESIWTIYGGNFVYQIVTKGGTRLPFIPDYIEDCHELLEIIQERSGKRIVSEYRTLGVNVKEDLRKIAKFFGRLKKGPHFPDPPADA